MVTEMRSGAAVPLALFSNRICYASLANPIPKHDQLPTLPYCERISSAQEFLEVVDYVVGILEELRDGVSLAFELLLGCV